MPLSWNEIRSRALAFSTEWKDESREHAEAKTFWDQFFNVFGVNRRRLAIFEAAVSLLGNKRGNIDLFWKGTLLVEHKSKGKSLDAAYQQAADYFVGIADEDLPRYVLVSDFQRFRLYDLEGEQGPLDFALADLHTKVHRFAFMLGHVQRQYQEEKRANIKAAALMGHLHDVLKESGYVGHPLEMLLVRMMFCLFADDIGIFEKDTFRFYLEEKTKKDGTDLGLHLGAIFETLDKPLERRQRNLDEDLYSLPYVNGTLFKERLDLPAFDSKSRETLLSCTRFNWSHVSPAVFGSLFQVAMDPLQRHYLGAHYTSEASIHKAIRPLFLDSLEEDFEKAKHAKKRLETLLGRIAAIRILDPACGCGTFLIVAYRELRLLELRIYERLKELSAGQESFGVDFAKSINVDSMFGIELEELPGRIAETALWVTDHQINVIASQIFGSYFTRLPLVTSPSIVQGNALAMDWRTVIPPAKVSYVVGNPPFAGKKRRLPSQNEDMERVCGRIKGSGVLDYVCCWFVKAAEYIKGTEIQVALVATNSITQGEQVGILWRHMLTEGVQINFAHRTFEWTSDAGGAAHVHVVVIGFGQIALPKRRLFEYVTPYAEPIEATAKNINPYLVDAETVLLTKRSTPLNGAPRISFGSMPNDDGNLLLTGAERKELVKRDPNVGSWIRPFVSSREFLANVPRFCLWLEGIKPSELRHMPAIVSRVEAVKTYREKSTRPATKRLAATPTLFGERRQPKSPYIVIPRHSSEQRRYIPMSVLKPASVVGDSCAWVASSDLYVFGVLMSDMHMAWVRQVCGRIKWDFRYSNETVYNNFPWPSTVSESNIEAVREAAQVVLNTRTLYEGESLAGLYDPVTMPPNVADAHKRLDRAVDKCYRSKSFTTDLERLDYLFDLYVRLGTNPDLGLTPPASRVRQHRRRRSSQGK